MGAQSLRKSVQPPRHLCRRCRRRHGLTTQIMSSPLLLSGQQRLSHISQTAAPIDGQLLLITQVGHFTGMMLFRRLGVFCHGMVQISTDRASGPSPRGTECPVPCQEQGSTHGLAFFTPVCPSEVQNRHMAANITLLLAARSEAQNAAGSSSWTLAGGRFRTRPCILHLALSWLG